MCDATQFRFRACLVRRDLRGVNASSKAVSISKRTKAVTYQRNR
jgi:hypothetical protein